MKSLSVKKQYAQGLTPTPVLTSFRFAVGPLSVFKLYTGMAGGILGIFSLAKVRQNRCRGLTLVETIVVVTIFTVLMGAVMGSVAAFYRFNAYSIAQAYQVEHARRGIEFLVRDIREMTYADDGTFPLAIMETNRIAFYSDIDRDNSVEYVEYELEGTILEKRIYDATGTPPVYDGTPEETLIISEYVQNLLQATSTFTYYDTNGVIASPTSTVTDIRYVETKLIVNIDPIRDPGEYMLRSSAALRNLKDNL